MSDYWTRRDRLILEDRAQRVDVEKLRTLSDIEAQAEQVIRQIRAEEAAAVWGVGSRSVFEYNPVEDSPNVFPGMAFLTGMFASCRSMYNNHICPSTRDSGQH